MPCTLLRLSFCRGTVSCPLFSVTFPRGPGVSILRETIQFIPGSLRRADDAVCWIPSTQHTHLILTFLSPTRLYLDSLEEGWTRINSEL